MLSEDVAACYLVSIRSGWLRLTGKSYAYRMAGWETKTNESELVDLFAPVDRRDTPSCAAYEGVAT